MEELSLNYYLFVFRLRQKIFIPVFILMLVLTGFFAARWSSYKSEAMIQISQSQISEDSNSANKSPDDMADLRISYLQQKVLSVSSLVDVINKFNLYPGARDKLSIATIADKMAKDIKISMQSTALANPASAQKATASQLEAMAFTISFKYSNPAIAQQVTNELVSRFLDEDMKQRRAQAKETSSFLQAQIDQLEKSLSEQEKKIADIRSANGASRPDALAFNQQAMATSMLNLQNLESQIASLLGTIGSVKGQLSATDPYSRVMDDGKLLTTPTIQLRSLRTQYASLSAQYGPKHPDVIKTKHQLEALEKQMGSSSTAMTSEIPTLKALITDVETKLTTAQKTYGPQNPEVQSLTGQLEKLNAQLKAAIEKMPLTDLVQKDADNPVYLQLTAQLEAANKQYSVMLSQKANLQAQIDKYQKAVILNPGVEQQLAAIAREYDNDNLHYRDLKMRKMQADIAGSIETESVGRRLIVLNPPEMPTGTSPSRILLFACGVILSLFSSLIAVMGVQILSQSIVGAQHVELLTGAPPLVVVPRLRTPDEKFSYWQQYRKPILLLVLGVAVLLILISFFVMPLDEILSVITDAFV